MNNHLKRLNWDAGIKAAVCLDAAFQNVEIKCKREYETAGNRTMRADNVLYIPNHHLSDPDSIYYWAKKHAVMEGKDGGSTLNLKIFWKLQEYGCRLLAQPGQIEGVPLPDETTVFFIKEGYPRRLVKEVRKLTGKKGIEKKGEGIYCVDEMKFAGETFLAVTDRLNGKVHPFLRCISKRASASDLERMFSEATACQRKGCNIEDLRTVMIFAIHANRKEYEKMKRKRDVMSIQEMEDIVIDDILKESVQKRIDKAVKEKDNELKEKDNKLKEKDNKLKDKDNELKSKENELKDKDSLIANQQKEFKRYMRSFVKELGVDGVIDTLKKANPELTNKDLKRIKSLIM